LLPKIEITQPILGEDAREFAKCFTQGVIEIESLNGTGLVLPFLNLEGVETAVVKDPRKDTISRECLRHPKFSDRVSLSRVPDHFICKEPSLI